MVTGFLWGLFEATFFFIVPDVWLGYWVLLRGKRGFTAIIPTVSGATFGGILMYLLAKYDYLSIYSMAIQKIPGISLQMTYNVMGAVETQGSTPMWHGMITGVPYKLYALASGMYQEYHSFWVFIVDSIFARSSRFLVVTLFIYGVSKLLQKWLTHKTILWVYGGGWLVFYGFYFSIMGF